MIYILPILGVLISFLFVVIAKPQKNESFKLLLAFSGAFLLALTIFEMLPEVYSTIDSNFKGKFSEQMKTNALSMATVMLIKFQ